MCHLVASLGWVVIEWNQEEWTCKLKFIGQEEESQQEALGEEHFTVNSAEIGPKQVVFLSRRREGPVWQRVIGARGVGIMR